MNEIIDRPKGRWLKPLRALWPYISRHRGILVLALGALLITSAALLVLPLAFRNVIDQGMVVRDARRSIFISSRFSRPAHRSACSPRCASIS